VGTCLRILRQARGHRSREPRVGDDERGVGQEAPAFGRRSDAVEEEGRHRFAGDPFRPRQVHGLGEGPLHREPVESDRLGHG